MTRTTIDLDDDDRALLQEIGKGAMVKGIRKLIRLYAEEAGAPGKKATLAVPEDPKLEEIYRRLLDNSTFVDEGIREIKAQDAVMEVSRIQGISKNGAKARLDELEKKGFCKVKSGWRPRIMVFLDYEEAEEVK